MYKLLFLFLIVICFNNAAMAQTAATIVPAPPQGNASAYLLMDYHSGRFLAEKNIDEQVEPASLTKMMTAYIAGEELEAGHIQMDDQVLVSEKAWRMPGSRMFIEVNTRVSVEDLLNGVVIQSGNDASVALAEHISGSEEVFAQVMNQHAKRLGMNNTHFLNSTGMPEPGHVTTARDMAVLAVALLRDHPELYYLHAVKEFTYNDIKQNNRNQLLWRDASVDGIKTGHTEAAGYCLVSSAKRGDMRLISVVMGTESVQARTEFTRALLEYGFRFYESHIAAAALKSLGNERIWKGETQTLEYGVANDVYVTVPRGQVDKLKHQVELDQPVIAPVNQNARVGQLTVRLDDDVLVTTDIIALQSVAEAGLMGRMLDSIKMMLE